MPNVSLTGTELLEFTMVGNKDDQVVINSLTYRVHVPSPPAESDTQTAMAAVASLWDDMVISRVAEAYQLIKIICRIITAVEQTAAGLKRVYYSLQDELASPLTGAIEGASLPSYTSLSMAKITGLAGRNWRGRLAIAGVPEADTVDDGNALEAAALASWITAGEGLAAVLLNPGADGIDLVPILVSNKASSEGAGSSPWPSLYSDIQDIVPRPNVGSQLSRKRRPSG